MSTAKEHTQIHTDLTDSERDIERMQPEETTIEMPDVEDIPGQEHIRVPKMKEFQDTTISSDGEEGKGLFTEEMLNADTNVTDEEIELLSRTEESESGNDEDRRSLMLDDTDLDGDMLNEKHDLSGNDLDVPGTDADDANEKIGEEDEENNSYSIGGGRND